MSGTPGGELHASPIVAAHSIAVNASRTPASGTMPRSISRAALSSGRFSPSVAAITPLAPVEPMARSNALTVASQSVSSQRSVRGKSITSMFASKPSRAKAVNVSVSAASSPQLKVW